MPQEPDSKQTQSDLSAIFQEIHGSSDRAGAVTAAAYFEEILVLAIKARLIRLSKTKAGPLFNKDGSPLNTFYARAQMGFALGLYGSITLSDLDKARAVRNRFAHYARISSFDHPEVKEKCLAMHTARNVEPTIGPRADPPDTPRAYYLDSLLEIGARLIRSGPRSPIHLTTLENGLL